MSVTLNVERGDQELEGLALLVDGAMVASQSFGSGMDMGMTPPEDGAAEQAVHAFTMAFDSHDYDRQTGTPTYTNGEHTISAELEIGIDMADGTHGHETISSNVVSVEFDNNDFIAVSYSGLGAGAMNEQTGQVWHGGPGASVEISALPVLYSSGSVSSLTMLQFCGADAATDSAAPFSFTPDCAKAKYTTTPTAAGLGDRPLFNVGGSSRTVRGGRVYLDFAGPGAPTFQANPNDREEGWINDAVNLTGKYHATRTPDGWLTHGTADTGVGGYTVQLRHSGTNPSIVDAARAATPSANPTLPVASKKSDDYCFIASAVDLLGNESALPKAGDPCTPAPAGTMATTSSSLRAGVDVTAPTIQFTGASPGGASGSRPARSLSPFQVQVTEEKDGSGFGMTPVLATVHVRNEKNAILCGTDKSSGGTDLPGNELLTGVCEADAVGLTRQYIWVGGFGHDFRCRRNPGKWLSHLHGTCHGQGRECFG